MTKVGIRYWRDTGKIVPAKNEVRFDQAKTHRLPELQVDAATQDGADAVAGRHVFGTEAVQPQHRMRKHIDVLAAPHQARSDGDRALRGLVLKVSSHVDRQSPPLVKVVGARYSVTNRHAGELGGDGWRRRLEWRVRTHGHSAARVEPLIADKQIYFRGRFLRAQQRRQQQHNNSQNQRADRASPASLGTK